MRAIECIRYRGSNLGAGFATFNNTGGSDLYTVKAFIDGDQTREYIIRGLEMHGLAIQSEEEPIWGDRMTFGSWKLYVKASSDASVSIAINNLNEELMNGGKMIRGRFYSFGRKVEVYKNVGYPLDVAHLYGLLDNPVNGDMWIAHTRQPTNSPGLLPIWSHPFSSGNAAIVHNGDISSFGANLKFLQSRGVGSLVGTDSEVIAYLVDYLARVEGISMEDVGTILTNPYDRLLSRMATEKASNIRRLIHRFRGAQLDGPFTVVAGYGSDDESYLLAAIDRSKFRPIIIGEDRDRYFVASEECQIRSISPHATIWTPAPGRYILASTKRGLIEGGREDREMFYGSLQTSAPKLQKLPVTKTTTATPQFVDAAGLNYRELNSQIKTEFAEGSQEVSVINVSGHRYIGLNLKVGTKLALHGIAGNCLGNFNQGGNIVVQGNASDDVGDVMHSGRIVIHGDARDVLGQALQGGRILVRGNVGNRAVIQMREYRDSKPAVVIGGRGDDYFGEYMAGGVAIVLGLDTIDADYPGQLVGEFVATGMLGGTIYIRSKVRSDSIGLSPPRADVLSYLESLYYDGDIDIDRLNKLRAMDDLSINKIETSLPEPGLSKIRALYRSKYSAPLRSEYRRLSQVDLDLVDPPLREFCSEFGIDDEKYRKIRESNFTIISVIPPKTHDRKVQEIEE